MQQRLFPQGEIDAYAASDARACFDIFARYSQHWPEHEQRLASLTIEQGARGVHIDQRLLHEGLERLDAECSECVQQVPWAGRAPISSHKELQAACARVGILPPESTAQTSEDFERWLGLHEDEMPWVRAIGRWRKANRMRKLLETIQSRISEDGRLRFGLKYCGAALTGRWSGDSGLNMQNLNRGEVCGVSVRHLFRAAPGYVLVVADLSQIEPRCLAWLSGDHEMLEDLRNGMPLYEAHARATMDWRGGILKREDPQKYALAKARVLGLSYGCGAPQFVRVAKILAGLDITLRDAQRIVRHFRSTNPAITGLWNRLEDMLRRSAEAHEPTWAIQTPAGRWLRYFGPDAMGDGLRAATLRGGRSEHWHGSKLVENLVQATARDVFADCLLRIEAAGIKTLWTVHDEVIAEVPEAQCAEALATMLRLMRTAPIWMQGLPLDAEGRIMTHYDK
jgi:DNA polymerase